MTLFLQILLVRAHPLYAIQESMLGFMLCKIVPMAAVGPEVHKMYGYAWLWGNTVAPPHTIALKCCFWPSSLTTCLRNTIPKQNFLYPWIQEEGNGFYRQLFSMLHCTDISYSLLRGSSDSCMGQKTWLFSTPKEFTWGGRESHSSVVRQYPPVYITRPRIFFLLQLPVKGSTKPNGKTFHLQALQQFLLFLP